MGKLLGSIGLAIGVLLPVAPLWAADGDTHIALDYGVLAISAMPGGPSGVAKHHFSLVLKPDRQIAEQYEGGGVHRRSSSRDVKLGSDEPKGVEYHVVDENTIERIQTTDTHVSTITIHVSGKTCSMDMRFQLKPGAKYFISFSQTLGRPIQYKSFSLAHQSCKIE